MKGLVFIYRYTVTTGVGVKIQLYYLILETESTNLCEECWRSRGKIAAFSYRLSLHTFKLLELIFEASEVS